MKKSFVLIFIFFTLYTPQFSYALKLETAIDTRKKFFNKSLIKEDIISENKGEFSMTFPEVGFPLMPKMTNYWGCGFQVAGRPSYDSPVKLQAFIKLGQYGISNSRVTHTMIFEDTPTEVDIIYDNLLVQFGFGFKETAATDKFFRPFMEANLGLAHIRNSMHFPDFSSYDNCRPSTERIINKDWGSIFNFGFGLEIGRYDGNMTFFLGFDYTRSFRPMEYMHQKYMKIEPNYANHNHAHHHNSKSGERDVYADFINILSHDVHNHKVGEIYRSHLQFVNINFGIIVKM